VVKLTSEFRVWSLNNVVYKTKNKNAKSTEFYDNRRSIPHSSTELLNINTR